MSSITRRAPWRRLQSLGARRWLLIGACGVLVILLVAPFRDAWAVNRASILVNRAVVAEAAGAGPAAGVPSGDTAAAGTAASEETTGVTGDVASDLQQAMDLMRAAALRGPHTAARETPIWRTYGAAAALAPSEEAYNLLVRSRDAGRLDRVGQLWLGEVAAATDHWEAAADAYRRVDASNLLISRADALLQAGENDRAVRQYNLAKISLDAAVERENARRLLSGREGETTGAQNLMSRSAERVTALYRIGRGILTAGRPAQAATVLEEGLEMAATASPGVVVEHSLDLSLALALAQTLPALPNNSTAVPYFSYYPDQKLMTYTRAVIRVRTLVYQGTRTDLTGSVCVQAGHVLLLIGDEEQGVAFLRKAIELDPLLPDAYLALGSWYESKGMKMLPRRLYEEACRQLPANLELATAYAIACYKSLPPAEALPILEKAAAADIHDPYLFAFLGDCYLALGQDDKAHKAYEDGLDRSPGAKPLLERLAAIGPPKEALP